MRFSFSAWLHRRVNAELIRAVALLRNAACAVLRIHRLGPTQVQCAIVGTAWGIESNRLLVTANHVFNGGQPRDPNDKFYVFAVPENGPKAYHIPVTGFVLEDSAHDVAIIEITPPPGCPANISAVPISFKSIPDGEEVITYGFPAPQVAQANVDPSLNWRGGNLFLKGNANTGIVSAQFDLNGVLTYELNVGWHHGESGGPVVRVDPLSAIAIMQRYRNIQTQHGVVVGPHQGNSLVCIEKELRQHGATII